QALEQTAAYGIRVKSPKTRHGRRTISLPAHTVAELRQHWREQQEQRLAAGLGESPENAPVLATSSGGDMKQGTNPRQTGDQKAANGQATVTPHTYLPNH